MAYISHDTSNVFGNTQNAKDIEKQRIFESVLEECHKTAHKAEEFQSVVAELIGCLRNNLES